MSEFNGFVKSPFTWDFIFDVVVKAQVINDIIYRKYRSLYLQYHNEDDGVGLFGRKKWKYRQRLLGWSGTKWHTLDIAYERGEISKLEFDCYHLGTYEKTSILEDLYTMSYCTPEEIYLTPEQLKVLELARNLTTRWESENGWD